MKRAALAALIILAATLPAQATNFVTQAVFSIASSAKTGTANLRITPMTPKVIGKDDNAFALQWFQWQANQAQNRYLTKTQTVDLTDALCAWVQVDQATKVTVNSETAYMTLASGFSGTVCFK